MHGLYSRLHRWCVANVAAAMSTRPCRRRHGVRGPDAQRAAASARYPQDARRASAVRAAAAQASAQQVTLDKLRVVAPRAGVIDSLPYELGDQAPVGAPLAILLVGQAPYARVYVPEPIRADVRVGSVAHVYVDGREQPLDGKVRMIRSEPSFTPYYALIGDDVARLSYLAEITLTGKDARNLPAGLPVRVEFKAGQRETTSRADAAN